jgi:hypothetical protein
LDQAVARLIAGVLRPVALTLTPEYVDLFGLPELRLPRVEPVLGPLLLTVFRLLYERSAKYFRRRNTALIDGRQKLSGFIADKQLNRVFPRLRLVRIVIAKVLLAAAAARVLPEAVVSVQWALRRHIDDPGLRQIYAEVASTRVLTAAAKRAEDWKVHPQRRL